MYLHGQFLTLHGETVTVHILAGDDRTDDIEIGDDGAPVRFTDDPVEIRSEVNDTLDTLLRTSATIRLETRGFIPGLFSRSCMETVVNVFKGAECVFAGYLEPMAYSQDFNEAWDGLELSCVDALSALEHTRWADIGRAGVSYDDARASAGQPTFATVLSHMRDRWSGLDITGCLGEGGTRLYYDGSKALRGDDDPYRFFSRLAVSELLFLGSEEDDAWSDRDVLETVLKYLGLHIVQYGFDFHIFAWESVLSDAMCDWRGAVSGSGGKTTPKSVTEISLANVASDDTTISVGEAYNLIRLSCDTVDVDTVIESPLDADALTSPYSNRQKYMTEIAADGNGERAQDAFCALCMGQETAFSGAHETDWYMQVLDNPKRTFRDRNHNDVIEMFCKGNANQEQLPNLVLSQGLSCAIVSFGKVERRPNPDDNSPQNKLDMEDALVIGVNGNVPAAPWGDVPEVKTPTPAMIQAAAPLAAYEGAVSGGVYSPADTGATNYIVFSGKVLLNPKSLFSRTYAEMRAGTWLHKNVINNNGAPEYTAGTPVYSPDHQDGRYYTQKYWRADTPQNSAIYDDHTTHGLEPFTGGVEPRFEFEYSEIGDSSDRVSKIAVVACMLVIGDKCVVETGTQGQPSDFAWRTFKTREQCASDDEYYAQSFTIGFDPKIGDKLIGTEFDIQNNISWEMGIDATGTAIPVRKADKVSGRVRFEILGPVNNAFWNKVTRRHPTFFRHTKWTEEAVPLLAYTQSIMLKKFEVKVYSDTGLLRNLDDSDLVYMSDTDEEFVNSLDESVQLNSALTLAECRALGVTDAVRLSTPLDLTTGYGLVSVFDRARAAQEKPEKLWVDSVWTEWHLPRVEMVQKLEDRPGAVAPFAHYTHPAMPGKKFYVTGVSRDLIAGYAELKLKEIWNND